MEKKKNNSNGILNKMKKRKQKYSLFEILIIMIVMFGLGTITGGAIMYYKSINNSTMSINEFLSAYNEIVDNYYQDVDKDKLLEYGISGMLRYLGDPYSTYMNEDVASDFSEDVDGTYQGIGAEIKYNTDNLPIIGRVFEESPAEKAGLKENDIIVKVNDEDVTKLSLSEIANKVKGDNGTSVKVIIKRDGKEQEFTIIRSIVDNISVTSEIIEKNNKKIGYLNISIFASNTYNQFKNELEMLESKNIDSLIIDVRGNSGGYLSTVTDIISLFIKNGEPIYQLKTKENIEIINDKTADARSYPIVVLADGNSASASELLVGALSEIYGAQIVGTKTFGKGKVQKLSTLSSGAMFKYTYQEWLTPNGNYIDQVGIEPDVEIKYERNEKGIDNQKNKAIEVISK